MGAIYQICSVCKGSGQIILDNHRPWRGIGITLNGVIEDCPWCKPLRVVETGLTTAQVEKWAERAKREQEEAAGLPDLIAARRRDAETEIIQIAGGVPRLEEDRER